jgi:hypothetical protein
MSLSAYVRAHQYPAARKTHGVHMRTYAYVRIRPRGKRAESTRVRTYPAAWKMCGVHMRTYALVRHTGDTLPVRTRTHAWRHSPAYVRNVIYIRKNCWRHFGGKIFPDGWLTSFWRENFSRWGILSPYARARTMTSLPCVRTQRHP